MRKLSRSAYEDTKGLVRAAETLLEVVVMTLLYYGAFRKGYEIEHFVYKGKYVLMGVYAALLYVMFLNSDCTLFGQLHRLDLIIGQVISLFVVNFLTYFQLCLIANTMIAVGPMLLLLLAEIVVAVVLIYVYTELYYKLYAPHDMLLVYGNKRGIGLKIKMDSRRDKYNVSKLMSIDEGLEAVCQETRRHDAVILTDIPSPDPQRYPEILLPLPHPYLRRPQTHGHHAPGGEEQYAVRHPAAHGEGHRPDPHAAHHQACHGSGALRHCHDSRRTGHAHYRSCY